MLNRFETGFGVKGSAQSAVENKLVSHVEFKQVKSEAELQQALAENNKSLVMLDLYADWCVACKEFEKKHLVISCTKPLAICCSFKLI